MNSNIMYSKMVTLNDSSDIASNYNIVEGTIKINFGISDSSDNRYTYAIRYWLDGEHTDIISFVSQYYSEALIEGLLHYAVNGMKQYVNRDNDFYNKYEMNKKSKTPLLIDCTCTAYGYITKHIDKFIRENLNSAYDNKRIVEFLSILSSYNVYNDMNDTIDYDKLDYYVEKQLEYFSQKDVDNSIETIQDFCKYFIPTMIDLSDNELGFVANSVLSHIKTVNNDDMVDFYYRCYLITNVFKSEEFSDCNIMEFDKNYKNIRNFNVTFLSDPFFVSNISDYDTSWDKENIEHVKTLKVKEFSKVYINSKLCMEPELFKRLIYIILLDSGISDNTQKEFLSIVENHDDNDKNNTYYARKIVESVNDYDSGEECGLAIYVYYYAAFIDYVVNNVDDVDENFIRTAINFMLDYKLDHIAKDVKNGICFRPLNHIALDKVLSVVDFKTMLNIFKELSTLDVVLTISEWDKFLNNYEDSKELPVSWQVELIK